MENQDFVEQLKNDFEQRRRKNARYSLRAYAKHLGLSPGTVSRLFSGSLHPTDSILNKVAHRFTFSEEELLSMRSQLRHNKKQRSIKNIEKDHLRKLEDSEYRFLSDWYHFAILELITLKSFINDPTWIANKLKLESPQIVRDSMQRLQDLNLIQIKGDKVTILDQHTTLLDETKTSEARKARQRQSLNLSALALEEVDINKRDHSALTISLDDALLPEIKRRIKVFRRSLANYIEEKSKNKNTIYEMQISFFPLSQNTDN